jgi:hypothetical protein
MSINQTCATGYKINEQSGLVRPSGIAILPQKQGKTARCMSLFDAIVAYKRAHDGISPSLRNLMESVGYASLSTAAYAVEDLVAEGLITRGERQSRHICVVGGVWTHAGAHDAVLSRQAQAAWEKIIEYKRANDGNAPCYRDLVRLCRFSSNSIAHAAVQELYAAQLVRSAGTLLVRHLEVAGGRWEFVGGD